MPGSRRNARAWIVAALALVTTACVSVPDDIKATFALPRPGEVDNFAANAPHGHAPPDDPTSTPVVAGLDASVAADAAAEAAAPVAEGMCPRDPSTSSSLDASASLSSNCTDAGITAAGSR
ncbi:MAG TPA: hypothetical protein VF407_01660 [Polyangiaceae bacterium]